MHNRISPQKQVRRQSHHNNTYGNLQTTSRAGCPEKTKRGAWKHEAEDGSRKSSTSTSSTPSTNASDKTKGCKKLSEVTSWISNTTKRPTRHGSKKKLKPKTSTITCGKNRYITKQKLNSYARNYRRRDKEDSTWKSTGWRGKTTSSSTSSSDYKINTKKANEKIAYDRRS